jgi:hypothetical protein
MPSNPVGDYQHFGGHITTIFWVKNEASWNVFHYTKKGHSVGMGLGIKEEG